MEALADGTITTNEQGCWSLQVDDLPDPSVIIWPAGTRVEADHIVLPSDTTLSVGDAINAGGGYLDANDAGGFIDEASLGECGATGVVVLNSAKVAIGAPG